MVNDNTQLAESPAPAPLFDYGTLEETLVANLEELATKCAFKQDVVRRTAAHAVIEIGCNLQIAHLMLAGKGREGLFRPWLEERCGISKSSAYKAMAAYKVFGKCPRVDTFDVQGESVMATTCEPATTPTATACEPESVLIPQTTPVLITKTAPVSAWALTYLKHHESGSL